MKGRFLFDYNIIKIGYRVNKLKYANSLSGSFQVSFYAIDNLLY